MNNQNWLKEFKEHIQTIFKRKPRYLNWLKIVVGIFFVVICVYYQFYFPHPEISEPIPVYTNEGLPLVVSTPVGKIYNHDKDMTVPSVSFGPIDFEIGGAAVKNEVTPEVPDTNITENSNSKKVEELKNEISLLEKQRQAIEDNILTLENQNASLTNINYGIQQKIMSYVKKGRFIDILLSAFIGAIVSIIFSYLLSVPNVREKIDSYLWKNNQEIPPKIP